MLALPMMSLVSQKVTWYSSGLTIQGPTDMFKLIQLGPPSSNYVHYVVQALCKRVDGIRLKGLLVVRVRQIYEAVTRVCHVSYDQSMYGSCDSIKNV